MLGFGLTAAIYEPCGGWVGYNWALTWRLGGILRVFFSSLLNLIV